MLVDSHCHLMKFHLRGDLAEILQEAREMGVGLMVAIGTDHQDWPVYLELAKMYPERIAYTVGLHPTSVGEDWNTQLAELPNFFAEDPRPRAVGEIGLDHFHLPKKDPEGAQAIRARQVLAFEQQLQIAKEAGMPVVIHSRNAFEECVDCIDRSGLAWERVVFHCFADGAEQMRVLKERGGRASFTGILTYKNGGNVREAVLEQGLDRLMLETDSPYLTPEPLRGQENHPGYTRHTAEACAQLFGEPLETIAAISTRNAKDFFDL